MNVQVVDYGELVENVTQLCPVIAHSGCYITPRDGILNQLFIRRLSFKVKYK